MLRSFELRSSCRSGQEVHAKMRCLRADVRATTGIGVTIGVITVEVGLVAIVAGGHLVEVEGVKAVGEGRGVAEVVPGAGGVFTDEGDLSA